MDSQIEKTRRMSGSGIALAALLAACVAPAMAVAQDNPPYTTYGSFVDLMAGENARYPTLVRVSDPGTNDNRNYTGFFFYQCQQFDPTGRYLLGMRVHFQNRDVQATDRADIGFFDGSSKILVKKEPANGVGSEDCPSFRPQRGQGP